MIGYTEREVFTAAATKVWRDAVALVAVVPKAHDPSGRYIRCHEIARAVGAVLGLEVIDGTSLGVEHSWCFVDRHTILDVYVPGRLPMVQLVDIGSPTLGRRCYAPGVRRRDIRDDVVEYLVGRMLFDADRGHRSSATPDRKEEDPPK